MWPFKSQSPMRAEKFSPSADMIEEAKRNPNGWVYKIEGNYGPNDRVPADAIVGGYKVNASGQLTGEFKANPNYRAKQAQGGL